mmetsp:Transcript_18791/g.34265  ORF Transcript_18791/g.34265 Transcript_18791/m.34265 type:complete len:238 (-) Transcript_18791:149-862(-)
MESSSSSAKLAADPPCEEGTKQKRDCGPVNNPRKGKKKKAATATDAEDDIKRVSNFKGVSWNNGRFQAQIQTNKKKKHLGYFKDEESAARRYDEAAKELDRSLNFPTDGELQAIKGGRGGKSRFKGVSWHIITKKWEAGIKIGGKKTALGHFTDELEAAHKYDEAASAIGRFPLNFPIGSGVQDFSGQSTKSNSNILVPSDGQQAGLSETSANRPEPAEGAGEQHANANARSGTVSV